MLFMKKDVRMPTAEEALPGREAKMPVAPAHVVTGAPRIFGTIVGTRRKV